MTFSRLLQICACLLLVCVVASQQQTRGVSTVFGPLSVDLDISGVRLSVRFSPELEKAVTVAQRLCQEQASRIGVTNENFAVCVERVGNYLQAAVDNWYEEKIFSTPLTVNGNRFDVQFIPEVESASAIATRLCQQNKEVLGFADVASCSAPVTEYLGRSVNEWYAEKTLTVPLSIDGKEFELSFLPERQSPVDMAAKLCREQAATLGVTEESFNLCVERVAGHLVADVTKWVQSKTLEFKLEINQKAYSFSFMPERENAETVSRRFCEARAEEFKLTRENFVSACVQPINARIAQVVQEWVNSKIVKLPITVDDRQIEISFIPERESTLRVARRFCLRNAEALQLTTENFATTCVAPINEGLVNAVRKANAKKA